MQGIGDDARPPPPASPSLDLCLNNDPSPYIIPLIAWFNLTSSLQMCAAAAFCFFICMFKLM